MFLLALAWSVSQGVVPSTTAVPFHPPNIIVVILDDVGIDQLAMYEINPAWGENHARTPVLDHLRANGVLFRRAWGAPLCSPSRAMLLTGRHSFRTGMLGLAEASGPCPQGYVFSSPQMCCPVADPTCSLPENTPVPAYFPNGYSLPESEVTIAEALRSAEYPTDVRYTSGAFGKWHLTGLPGDPCHAVRQGFDVFQGHLHNNEFGALDHYAWEHVDARAAADGCVSTTTPVQGQWDAERNAIDARTWIDGVLAAPDPRPFFAYVSFNPPHAPFQVPPQTFVSPQTWSELGLAGLDVEGRVVHAVGSCHPSATQEFASLEARIVYRASLEAIDALIGRVVLKSQAEPELLDNTLVFVVSDNGTPDWIYQATKVAGEVGANAPPFLPNHAKFQLYELGVRVPLLVAGPGVARGATCNALVSIVDLWATIADRALADVSGLVPANELDSHSFAHRLARPTGTLANRDRTTLYTESASRNGFVYDRGLDTWSPFTPKASRYQRAILDESGFKYMRRVLGTDPGCSQTASLCQQPPEEELFRLFDGATAVDPFERASLCGTLGSGAQVVLLRQRMAWSFSGY